MKKFMKKYGFITLMLLGIVARLYCRCGQGRGLRLSNRSGRCLLI